jgi:thiamine monophosphate synthase
MFAFKKKYFLIIENTRDIDLRNIKKYNKFIVIYRNNNKKENFDELLSFRKKCKLKLIDFYVANDIKLSLSLNSDGIYLSSYNKTFRTLRLYKRNFGIIGSAHNTKQISEKIKQGCKYVLFSKLFRVDYDSRSSFFGIIKYNKYANNFSKKLIPLGGIKINNLNSLKIVNSQGFAISSEIKKKPANIINRLF